MARTKGRTLSYDVSGVDSAGGDFELPPVGLFRAKVVAAEHEKPDGKNERVHVQFEITHDAKGKKVKKDYQRLHRYYTFGESAVGFWRQFLEAVGVVQEGKKKSEKGSIDLDSIEGESVLVRVRHEAWTEAAGGDGSMKAKPGNVMSLPDEDDEDEDEDEDDEDEDDDDDEDEDEDDEDEEEDEDEDEDEDDDEDEDEDDEDEDDDDDSPDYSSMSLKELNKLVKENEGDPKKVVGNAKKADTKKKKLSEWLEENANDDDEDADYSEWTDAELKEELDDRGLPTKGKTAVLIKRLEKDDESDEEEPF